MTRQKLACRLEGLVATWLDPDLWVTRIRLWLGGGPALVISGHAFDTDRPRYVVSGQREHEYLRCVRCGVEEYQGWRRWYGL